MNAVLKTDHTSLQDAQLAAELAAEHAVLQAANLLVVFGRTMIDRSGVHPGLVGGLASWLLDAGCTVAGASGRCWEHVPRGQWGAAAQIEGFLQMAQRLGSNHPVDLGERLCAQIRRAQHDAQSTGYPLDPTWRIHRRVRDAAAVGDAAWTHGQDRLRSVRSEQGRAELAGAFVRAACSLAVAELGTVAQPAAPADALAVLDLAGSAPGSHEALGEARGEAIRAIFGARDALLVRAARNEEQRAARRAARRTRQPG